MFPESYKDNIRDDVVTCLDKMGVQPILFIGSGISQRYYGGPSWTSLLSTLAEQCPTIDRDFAYYNQTHLSLPDVGSTFANKFREWAWGEGRELFPNALFEPSAKADIYIKHSVATYFEDLLSSESATEISSQFSEELEALKQIRPHAIITTNYDRFLEQLFPDYSPIIGERIIRTDYSSIGDILKIHGCSSEPSSIVLTREDYEEFENKKKYLSAKLLTFFAEHPLVFLGYSAEDSNIKAILSDIDEILAPAGDLIPNIYLVEWDPRADELTNPSLERLIGIGTQRSVRIKRIVANDFKWVYESFAVEGAIEAVNPQILRALMARAYELVRHDIPKRNIEVDYQTFEQTISEQSKVARLLGLTTLDDPTKVNAMYPFSLTQVGKQLGYDNWHQANQLIRRVEEEHGVNIKESDNRYHVAIMAGNVLQAHKYSQEAVDLLAKVRDEQSYDLDL